MKKFLVLAALALLPAISIAQQGPVRGEVSAGNYENIRSTSQALNVNVSSGTVTVGTSTATLTTTTPTVTNSSTTVLAANASRKSLLVQNNHATAIVYLNFTTTATTAHLALTAGQSLYITAAVPVAAVQAIGSIASNTSVVVVEGQ